MKRIALMPGSFDPPTVGHFDLIQRASKMFDTVYVTAFINTEKQRDTDAENPVVREKYLAALSHDLEKNGITNVKCSVSDELCSDFAVSHGANYLVKGVRSSFEFDYEYQLAAIMRKFSDKLETVLLPARPEYMYISSTYARDLIRYRGDLSDALTPEVAKAVREITSGKA